MGISDALAGTSTFVMISYQFPSLLWQTNSAANYLADKLCIQYFIVETGNIAVFFLEDDNYSLCQSVRSTLSNSPSGQTARTTPAAAKALRQPGQGGSVI